MNRVENETSTQAAGTLLPRLKRKCAFRLATTSYIIPAPILPNLRFLGPHLDEVEIVLFESKRGEQSPVPGGDPGNGPDRLRPGPILQHPPAVGSLLRRPRPRAAGPIPPDTALRFYERTLPLDPTVYILHLDSRRADGTPEEDGHAWLERVRESVEELGRAGMDLRRVAVENLEYPLQRILPLVESLQMTFCLDLGHLLRYGYDLESTIARFLKQSAMVHLHGVNGGRDHCGIQWIPQRQWETIKRALKDYSGGVSIEVFSLEDLQPSLTRMQEMAK